MQDSLFPCPCCGYIVFLEPPGSYDICPICNWEDDAVQLTWPTLEGGANHYSLIEGQRRYQRSVTSDTEPDNTHRIPDTCYLREPGWRPLDLSTDIILPEGCFVASANGETFERPTDGTRLYWWRDTYWLTP